MAVFSFHSLRTLLLYLLGSALSLLVLAQTPGSAPDAPQKGTPLRIQLKWFHQFQFAGLYAAIEQGYFLEQGLDVTLVEGGPHIDPAEEVAQGRADFGIGNSSLLIDRAKGRPLVALASIFQHSPFVILARRDDGVRHVKDLEGLTVMGERHAAELSAYLRLAGVNENNIHWVPHTGDVRSLQPGQATPIYATTAYTSSEPYSAIQANIPYRIFSPRELNIDFYGDTLFTSERMMNSQPEQVAAVRKAVIKGWEYAKHHQDEIIALIRTQYTMRNTLGQLSFEAQAISDLLASDLVDIGYMSRSRWLHILNVFQKTKLINTPFDLDDFLYQTDQPATIPPWLFIGFFWLTVVAVIALHIAFRFYRLSESRKQEIIKRQFLEHSLKEMAMTDPLTGLANRRHLMDQADYEIERARRHARPLSLLLFDLDDFKSINDQHGHVVGDQCIQHFSSVCRGALRNIDLAARTGGDEFVVLLPDTTSQGAHTIAQRICDGFSDITLSSEEATILQLTASCGVATLTTTDDGLDALVMRADSAMYACKHAKKV